MGGSKDNNSKQLEKVASSSDVEIETENVTLKRELGLAGGISFVLGTIVGSGIFVSPGGVLKSTGSVGLSLVVWVGAGLIALLGSLCYCELGTMIPKSGGEYSYLQKAYGNAAAFLFTWVSVVLIRPSSLAIMSLTFGTYFSEVFSICGTPSLLPSLAAIAVLLTVMILNSYSTALSTRLQVITTVAKVTALFVIIIGGMVKLAQGNTSELSTGFEGSVTGPSVIALAFYNALWSYDGWNNLNFVTEELKNPSKNLPRAITISVVSCIVIYTLTNIAYLSVMTKAELLDADAVAVVWGDRVLQSASVIIPLSVMISTFGSSNSTAFAGGRSVFAAARDGNLPEVLSLITIKQTTPLPSMLFTIVLAIAYLLVGDIESLTNFFSFTTWIFYGATFSSLLVFRYTMRDTPRPYKVPIVIPIFMVCASIYLVIAPIIEDPAIEFLYAAIFVVGGLVFYVPFVHYKLKLPYIDEITLFVELVFACAPASKYED